MRHLMLAAAFGCALLMICEQPLLAQLGLSCTVSTSGVAFGTYNVYNASPTDSIGTITYQCTAGVGVRIELSRGAAATFTPRQLTSGANTFQYNLYMDAARTTVWGDGTGGTSYLTDTVLLLPKTATIYGRIPARQDAAIGTYSDSVTATIVF